MDRWFRNAAQALALAAAVASASAARAQVAPDAQAVIDRWIEATGGRAAYEAERALYVRTAIEGFGLKGVLESWGERPDRSAGRTEIGPFALREGFDGTRAWRVDQNGKLQERDGNDLVDTRASAWFANERWAAPDGGGRIVRAGAEKDSAGTYAVLEVTPPAGATRRLWFDERSGHLVRSVQRSDARTIVNAFSDFVPFAGRVRARVTVVSIEGMPMNTVRAVIDSVAVAPSFPAATWAPPGESAGDVRFAGGASRAVIPFDYSVRHVWVKASLNGGPLDDWLLDTGASVSVIDSAYAAARGVKTEGRIGVAGAGSSGGASFATFDSLAVPGEGGGVTLGHQKVVVLSVNAHLQPFFWRPCAGILGYDFISRFVVDIDFARGRMVLHEPATFRYEGAGQAVPLQFAGSIPVIEATVDDAYTGLFRLDVGSGSTVDLHTPFVEKHGLREKASARVEAMGGGFGGTFTSDVTRMKRMRVGPFAWDDPIVILSRATEGALASEEYAGNIGNHLLERFRVTFDYGRKQVWLEPAARFGTRDRFTLIGAQLAKHGDDVVAMQVLAGSPAAAAGLREGDRVTAIDGRDIGRWTLDAINAVFEDGVPGSKHRVTVLRDGRKRTLRVTLRDML